MKEEVRGERERVDCIIVNVEMVVADGLCGSVLAMLLSIEVGDPVEKEEDEEEDELVLESVDVAVERGSSIVITSDGVSEMTCSLC